MCDTLRCRLLVLTAIALVAAPAGFAGPPAHADGLQRFVIPSLDGTPVILENPADGRAYSAWTYRSGAEFDVAVSVRESSGSWNTPIFFGRFDGVDQRSPALAVDPSGHVYLAYVASDAGRVLLATLVAGTSSWSTPIAVTPDGIRAAAPVLMIVGDRLVVGFRAGTRVGLVHRALVGAPAQPLGIQDGPDPMGDDSKHRGADPGPVPFGGGT